MNNPSQSDTIARFKRVGANWWRCAQLGQLVANWPCRVQNHPAGAPAQSGERGSMNRHRLVLNEHEAIIMHRTTVPTFASKMVISCESIGQVHAHPALGQSRVRTVVLVHSGQNGGFLGGACFATMDVETLYFRCYNETTIEKREFLNPGLNVRDSQNSIQILIVDKRISVYAGRKETIG